MALSATPPKSTLRSKLHLRPSTALKISRIAVLVLLALITIQAVSSALLWYAAKIKADSSSRAVATSPDTDVTTTTASLHGFYDYPLDVIQRGFEYGLTAGYGSTVVDSTNPYLYTLSATQGGNGLTNAVGIAIDASGNSYVADYTSSMIKKFSPTGTFILEWGGEGTGDGQFFQLGDIAIGPSGNLYVSEIAGARVQKFDQSGNYVSKWTLHPLEPSTTQTYGNRIAVDGSENVYVSGNGDTDPGFTWSYTPFVQKYTAGVYVSQIGSEGVGDGQYGTDPKITADAAGNVYVYDGIGERIMKFNSSGTYITQWGSAGSGSGQFSDATEIVIGPDGLLYVADSGNSRVQVLQTDGTYITEWSNPGFEFGSLWGVGVDSSGQIRAIGGGSVFIGSPSSNSTLTNLACDTTYHYRAFVTDADSTDYGADSTFTTEPCTGLRTITTLPADNLSQTGATLHGTSDYPQGITARGFQYGLTTGYGSGVVDNGAQPKYSLASQFSSAFTTNLALDSGGNRYTIDAQSDKIQKFDANGTFLLEWGGNGSGNLQFDNGCGCGPSSIAIDSNDYVYVADPGNSRIQKFDANGSFVRGWSESDYSEGQFLANGGSMGISVDRLGNIYVVNTNSADSVYKYDSAGNFLAKWGNTSGLHTPSTPAFDSAGNIYIGDIGNNRIQKFDANGTFLLEWGTYGTSNGRFDGGGGLPIAVGVNDNVFVVDSGNLRIQEFDTSGDYISKVDLSNSYTYNSGSYFAKSFAISQSGELIIPFGESVATVAHSIDAAVSGLTCSTTYHYRPYVTDSGGTQYGNDATFTTSACPPLDITSSTLHDGFVGFYYSGYIAVNNLSGGETYTVSSGSVPPGLTLGSTTGYLEGIPSQEGHYFFDVTVENSGSSDTAQIDVYIYNTNPQLSITTVAIPDTQVGASYQEYIYTSDSVGDVSFNVASGSLPDGLYLTSYGTSGVVYGTPTTPGTYTFTVQAQDSRGAGVGTDTQEYSITVTPSNINITTTDVLNGRVGSSYDRTLQYENANAQPTFSLESGTLPPGVSLTLQGHLQGTPTVAGVYFFSVQADDGFSTDIQGYSFIVVPPLPTANNSPFVTITSPNSGSSFTGGSGVVTGTGPANQAIQILIDGSQVGTTTATTQGTWSYQATGVAAGSHTLDAKWVPSSDVAFVPFMAEVAGQNGVQVIDNTSMKVLRTIGLPADLYVPMGATLNRSGTKLYVFGTNYDLTGTVREINLQTMAQRTVVVSSSTPSFLTSMSITDDDTTAVVTGLTMDGGIIRKLNLETFSLSGDGVTITMQDMGAEAPLLGSLDVSSGTLYAIAMGGLNKVYTYNIANNALQTISIAGGYQLSRLQYVGGKLYVLALGEAEVLVDRPLTLLTLNPSDGVVLNTHVIATLGELGEYLPTVGLAVDPSANFAYVVVGGTGNRLTRVNLSNNQIDAVTSAVATASSDSPNLTTTGDRLYTPGIFGLSAWNTQTLAPLPSDSTFDLYPALGSRVYGSSLLGVITPPKDSISFTVAATPVDCKATGTCPVNCEVTGTCPSNCTATNSCPENPPTVNPPTPAVVDSTSIKYPKIITTSFPPATSTVSRLGWFDRGVLAVAHFVPRQAAIGFPYLLFILLLLFALSLYYQSTNEVRKDKLNRQFLVKRKAIRAQQDNFIALASHYLNTPITIIQNGIEVMDDGDRNKKR